MKTKIFLWSALIVFIASSCVKEIDLELDSPDYTLLVVEGKITDTDSIQTIHLTLTSPYDSDKPSPPASGAYISVNDGTQTYLFNETAPGIYQNAILEGIVGKTYTLTIDFKGEVFNATSCMHPSFAIDSVQIRDFPFGWPADLPHYEMYVYGQESPVANQFYIFQHAVNGVWRDTLIQWSVFGDFLANGQYLQGANIGIFESYDDSVKVKVRAMSCSEDLFWFFDKCMFAVMPNMFFSPPPANVKGNISNGALGYFWATSLFESETYTVYRNK